MNNPEHMTATKLAIQNKQYWDSLNYRHEYQLVDRYISLLTDRLVLTIIKHHYINLYFAKWGWK